MDRDPNLFWWESISINTWVTKVPSGWILKSIDMKNELFDNESSNIGVEKVPVAMSNSMVRIDDTEHIWDFKNFKWENIARDTWRAKIFDGWILKCVDQREIYYDGGFNQIQISTTMEFVPDQDHSWKIVKKYKNKE